MPRVNERTADPRASNLAIGPRPVIARTATPRRGVRRPFAMSVLIAMTLVGAGVAAVVMSPVLIILVLLAFMALVLLTTRRQLELAALAAIVLLPLGATGGTQLLGILSPAKVLSFAALLAVFA